MLILTCAAASCSRDQEAGARANTSRRQPNFLLYVSDTLRADALGCYGNSTIDTPTLDGLAARGVLFQTAIAPSSWTRPSMASILTSLYPSAHKTLDRLEKMPPDVPRLTELLRREGYRTAYFTTNPNTAKLWGFGPGFDFFEEFGDWQEERKVKADELTVPSNRMHDAISQWLDGLGSDEPFFVIALAIDPHTPYDPPAEFDRYGSPGYRGRVGPGAPGPMRMNKMQRPQDRARLRSLYYAEVAFNDHTLGQLLEYLESSGRAGNTVIAYTSDHGEEFWEHGIRGHGHTLHAAAVHVPLIWYDPAGRKRGVRISRPVSTLDIMPTVLAAAGITPPDWLQGHSLFDETPEPRNLYSELNLDGRVSWAVYQHPWKLIWNQVTGEEFLFDVAGDPAQQQNLATAHPVEKARLRRLLDTHINDSRKHGDEISSGSVSLEEGDVPEQMRNTLKGLGYIEGDEQEGDTENDESSEESGQATGEEPGDQETGTESPPDSGPDEAESAGPSPEENRDPSQDLGQSHGDE